MDDTHNPTRIEEKNASWSDTSRRARALGLPRGVRELAQVVREPEQRGGRAELLLHRVGYLLKGPEQLDANWVEA